MDISKLVSLETKNLKKENKATVEKWKKTGLLEGLKTDYERNSIAILLENQAKELLKEATSTGTAAGSEEWSGVALPLVRRIFSEIASKEFVSVQPMNLPSGLVFWLDFKYGTGQPGFTTGSGKDSQADSVYGITKTTGDPSGGLYGAGRWGYSINDVQVADLAHSASFGNVITKFVTSSLTGTDYNFDTLFSESYAGQFDAGENVCKVTVLVASLSSSDLEGVRGFKISGTNIGSYFPQFTTLNAAKTQLSFVVSASADITAKTIAIDYHKQPTDVTRGDFEDTSGGATPLHIPELNVEMRSEPIVAKTRKLKAIWSPEFAQDLNAYHALDAEAELTSMLSEYISQEIDFEILDMLIENAMTTERWSAKVAREYDSATGEFVDYSSATASALAYTQQTWFQTLGTKIQKVSNKIHQKTMRGGANFLVCSPEVSTILESIPGYAADTNGDQFQYAFGVQKVGMINNRFTVYKNPYMLENTILMGYRGSQFLETGAVFAPYIPLIMTPLVYDPDNFTPRKGVMTRYAKKITRPEFYGKILVHDLTSV